MFELIMTTIKARKRLALSVMLGSFALLLVFGIFSSRVYEVNTSIYVHKKIPDLAGSPGSQDLQSQNLGDHIKIIKSDMVMNHIIRELKAEFPKHRKLSAEKLANRLRIVGGKNTKVIDMSFQDNDNRYAYRVLELSLAGYEKALKGIAEQTRKKSLDYMQVRLNDIAKEKDGITREIAVLESRIGTTDIGQKNDELLKVNSEFRTRLQDVKASIAAANLETLKLQKTLNMSEQDIKGLARVREDNGIRVLQEELARRQSELSNLQSVYTDNYKDVVEKKRAVENIESKLQARIQELYGNSSDKDNIFFSEVENSLGKKLLDLQVTQIGLIGQKHNYEKSLTSLNSEFGELVNSKREVDNLRFRLDTLKAEEQKILAKLQDGVIEQDMVDTQGLFTIITPPTMPADHNYIFPPHPKELLAISLLGSLLLSVFSLAIAEFLDPKVFNLSEMAVFAEISRFGKAVRVAEVQAVYHNLSLSIKKARLKTVALFHLCGAVDPKSNEDYKVCPYSPGVFARQLASMFAEKNFRTLLVDCSEMYASDESAREKLAHYPDYVLYRYSGMESLDILSPSTPAGSVFDPNVLNLLPDRENYDLILLNVSLSDNDLATNLICETADATVIGISKSNTPSKLLAKFQKIAREREVNTIGSIIFP